MTKHLVDKSKYQMISMVLEKTAHVVLIYYKQWKSGLKCMAMVKHGIAYI